jgi:tetratricopeptide (TPR) repeat protein
LSGKAAAIAGPMRAPEVLAGDLEAVDRFCATLVAPADRPTSYEQAERLFRQGQDTLERSKGETGEPAAATLTQSVAASCAARSGFGQRDEVWAWNEYNIGQALFRLGREDEQAATLKLAVLASLNAAEVFAPSDEGWGWSRYNAGQGARVLSEQREDEELYRAKAIEVLRQVVANAEMPPEQSAYAKLELSHALMDAHADGEGRLGLREARQLLVSASQQDGFRDDAGQGFERLRSVR